MMANFGYNPRTKELTIWAREVDLTKEFYAVLILGPREALRLFNFLKDNLRGNISNAEEAYRYSQTTEEKG